MNYRFTNKCRSRSAEAIWKSIQKGLSRDVTIQSIVKGLPYTTNFITGDVINFQTPTRKSGEPDIIFFKDFAEVISRMQELQQFNTSSSKKLFIGTEMYGYRSPFFAILLSARIIEPVA